MKCSQAQELLSAFHDGELQEEARQQIEEHLSGCPTCSERLHELREISIATRRLDDPQPPDDLWISLEKQLNKGLQPATDSRLGRQRKTPAWTVAVTSVATLILVATAIWIGRNEERGHDHSAADIGHHFVEYRKHPEETQRDLIAKFQGRQVDLREARRELHFQPVAANSLPGNISLKNVYILKMPCCLCVQSVYERPDKSPLMLLEHEGEQPEWFGNRPAIKAMCCGQPATIVQCDGELAVTWKSKQRFVTVVGARDLEEISDFVTYLNDPAKDTDG